MRTRAGISRRDELVVRLNTNGFICKGANGESEQRTNSWPNSLLFFHPPSRLLPLRFRNQNLRAIEPGRLTNGWKGSSHGININSINSWRTCVVSPLRKGEPHRGDFLHDTVSSDRSFGVQSFTRINCYVLVHIYVNVSHTREKSDASWSFAIERRLSVAVELNGASYRSVENFQDFRFVGYGLSSCKSVRNIRVKYLEVIFVPKKYPTGLFLIIEEFLRRKGF